MQQRQSIHGEWSSRWAFVLAATGAAVGLGNIWKFPYITGLNGGGAFVIIYLVCVLLIGIPLLMAEILLGRSGRQNPADSIKTLALESGKSRHWQWVGVLAILSSFLILTYYSVVAGWTADYIFQAAAGDFTGGNPQQISSLFNQLVSSPWQLIFWHSIIILLTTLVVARGVRKGLEKAVIYMFPAMLVLLLILVGYSIDSGYFIKGVSFLFHPDFSKITSEGTLSALGHAFFTLSLATGSIMMYGAYLPKNASITSASFFIAIADTGIALLAGLAIFPIVFANHLTPGAGPGLIFKTLPIAFGKMPYGEFFATLFFVMLFLAAFTSAISLMEPSVAWMIEKWQLKRVQAAIIIGFLIWLIGLGTVFSFNLWENFTIFNKNFFDLMDYLTANIMLPLGGLLTAIFAAWLLNKKISYNELQYRNGTLFMLWRFTLRYISPIAIFIVLLKFMGLF